MTKAQWQAVVDFASAHFLAPLLYAKIKASSLPVPEEIMQHLRRQYIINSGRNVAIYSAFRQFCQQLQAANIPIIPLKGVYLAEAVYPTPGERVMGDLDLLVPKKRIEEAINLAINCHFMPTKAVHLEEWLKSKHQVCPQYNPRSQLTLEWHWHIATPSPQNSISISDLWQRALPMMIADQSVLVFTAEDTILHLVHHAAYHHTFYLAFGIYVI